MPLFGGSRDASFLRTVNKELINRVVNTEVVIYKFSAQHTRQNIYGEAEKKFYYAPIRINCLVKRGRRQAEDTDRGVDVYRDSTIFSFLRDTLKDIQLVIESGDVIEWDKDYYEVFDSKQDQIWSGRNPETNLATTEDKEDEFGYNVSVIVSARLARLNEIDLVDTFIGNDIDYSLPKNI